MSDTCWWTSACESQRYHNSGLQTRGMLQELLSGIGSARNSLVQPAAFATSANLPQSKPHRPKIVLKIAPDLDEAQLRDVAEAIRTAGAGVVDGVIVSNTTIQRPKSLSDRMSSLLSPSRCRPRSHPNSKFQPTQANKADSPARL